MKQLHLFVLALGSLLLAGCASVPMASSSADAQAKQFTPQPGRASIYVTRGFGVGSDLMWDVMGGGRLLHTLNNHQKTVTAMALDETGSRLLLTKVDSWMTGVNKNVPGRLKRTFMAYAGGAPKYRQKVRSGPVGWAASTVMLTGNAGAGAVAVYIGLARYKETGQR